MPVSCGKQKAEWKGSIEEVEGITVVSNPVEPIFADDVLELEEDLVLGEREGREEYLFSRIMFDDVKAVNDGIGKAQAPLGLELDYERIKATRPRIAEMLR